MMRRTLAILAAACAAAVLVLADLYAGWDSHPTLGVIVNYPLMILVFLISAVVVRRFVALERQAEAHLEQLGDFKRAPIVSQRGSANQWLGAAGLVYTW